MEGKTKTAEEILNIYLSRCYNVHNVSMSDKFRGYLISALNEYATQERDRAVSDFKDKLINEISEGNSIDTSYVYYAELVGLIEKLK